MANRILSSLMLTALTGCGGGGDSTPPAAIPTASTASCATIALYGDSTDDGTDGSTRAHASIDPTAALQTLMDTRFGAGKVVVTNKAVGGTSSGDLVAVSPAFTLAVINFGINDSLHGVPIADYKANLRKLYRPGVVFKTPNPIYGEAYTSAPADDSAYVQAMREVSVELGAPLIDTNAYVLSLQDWRSLLPDGVHPTTVLYGLIAQNSMATLVPLTACK